MNLCSQFVFQNILHYYISRWKTVLSAITFLRLWLLPRKNRWMVVAERLFCRPTMKILQSVHVWFTQCMWKIGSRWILLRSRAAFFEFHSPKYNYPETLCRMQMWFGTAKTKYSTCGFVRFEMNKHCDFLHDAK